jgi:hypothetical protein
MRKKHLSLLKTLGLGISPQAHLQICKTLQQECAEGLKTGFRAGALCFVEQRLMGRYLF